jgi:hypothetical protein
MKRVFLMIAVPALLVAMGFAQTTAASGNTDQINIKGCLRGSDGNYTVAEDNTGKIFKITTSSADLNAHLDHDVNLIGHKAGTAENSLAVTEINMISEHCTAAAAAPVASVSASSETAGTPAAAAAPAAAPDATISAPSETASTPAAAAAPAAAPDATISAPSETASTPAAAAVVHRTRPSARPREPAATPAAKPAPAEPVRTPVADAVLPTEPVGTPSETASTSAAPAAPAAPAPKASTSRSAGMLVPVVVVVLLIGAAVPLYNRWRKRKLLEQARGQNLSFTKEPKSDPGTSDKTGGRKAA